VIFRGGIGPPGPPLGTPLVEPISNGRNPGKLVTAFTAIINLLQLNTAKKD